MNKSHPTPSLWETGEPSAAPNLLHLYIIEYIMAWKKKVSQANFCLLRYPVLTLHFIFLALGKFYLNSQPWAGVNIPLKFKQNINRIYCRHIFRTGNAFFPYSSENLGKSQLSIIQCSKFVSTPLTWFTVRLNGQYYYYFQSQFLCGLQEQTWKMMTYASPGLIP